MNAWLNIYCFRKEYSIFAFKILLSDLQPIPYNNIETYNHRTQL